MLHYFFNISGLIRSLYLLSLFSFEAGKLILSVLLPACRTTTRREANGADPA
jgi:hypothetical protein